MSTYKQRTEAELALDAVLRGLTPKWTTKNPGVAFRPVASKAYQVGRMIKYSSSEERYGGGVYTIIRGLYQCELYYPTVEKKSLPLFERAQIVCDAYFPLKTKTGFVSGNTTVIVSNLPEIGPLIEDSPHILIPVTVRFHIHDRPV